MDELAGGGGGQGMAAPPRPQQGPGGNLSLPPGANGAPGGGGPPAAEAAGPPAGPELSRPQQYTIPGILHYIQHEWARFEMERAHWEVERAELQVPHPGQLRAVARARAGGGARAGARALRGGGDLPERLRLASGDGAPGAPSPAPAAARTLLTGGALRASLGQPFWLLAWRPPVSSGGTYWASSGFGPSASGRESGVGPLGVEFALVGPLDGENTRRGPGMSVLLPGSCTPSDVASCPLPRASVRTRPLTATPLRATPRTMAWRPTGEVCLPILNSFKYPGCRSTHLDFL